MGQCWTGMPQNIGRVHGLINDTNIEALDKGIYLQSCPSEGVLDQK